MVARKLNAIQNGNIVITAEALINEDESLPPVGKNLSKQIRAYNEGDFELLGAAASERPGSGIAYSQVITAGIGHKNDPKRPNLVTEGLSIKEAIS